jgi:predicted anti-sigma-YlaC factor YlaD
VNRMLTEGRRAFLMRVSGIERGAECARYEPLLSALADGEASAEDLARLRPHMQACLSCRAALRGFRAVPDPLPQQTRRHREQPPAPLRRGREATSRRAGVQMRDQPLIQLRAILMPRPFWWFGEGLS